MNRFNNKHLQKVKKKRTDSLDSVNMAGQRKSEIRREQKKKEKNNIEEILYRKIFAMDVFIE